MKTQTPIDRIIFFGILALLVFAPLAFGSVHVWAYSILEFGVFLLLALWVAGQMTAFEAKTLCWVKTPVNGMLGLFLLLIGLQLLPLPAFVAAIVSPHAHADKKELFSLLSKTADGPAWMTLAYYHHATLVEWLKLGAYCGMFFLVVNTLKSRKQIDVLVVCLIFLGLFQALYAIYQVAADTPRVWWWVSRVGHARYASGTFIVSNHFAAYMGLTISLTLGFMIAQKKKGKRLPPGLGGLQGLVQKIVNNFSPESSQAKTTFLFFAGIVMGISLLMSASKAGIFCLALAMLLVTALLVFKKSFQKYAILTICFCLVAFLYALNLGIEPTLKKFERSEQGLQLRWATTRSMFPMMADYPVAGVGLGNFRYLYPRYVPADYDGVSSSGYSHNDWVEAGTETGFLGLAVIGGAFLIYLYRMTRLWKIRNDRHAVGIGAGVLAGLLAMSFHSFFDFNLRIPANPLTLAAILGLGYAALHRRGHGYSQSFFYRKREIPLSPLGRLVIAALVLSFSGFGVYYAGKHLLAEAACPSEWNPTLNLNWNPMLADIDRAIARNDGNFEYHHKRAWHFTALNPANESERKDLNREARRSLEQALRLNPAHALSWYRLGYVYSANRSHLYDYLNTWLPLADACFDAAVKCAPKDEYLLFNIGRYWVWRARLLPESPVVEGGREEKSRPLSRKQGIQKFQRHFQRLLAINPANWKEAVRQTWEYFPSDAVVLGIVPDHYDGLKSEVLQFLAKLETPEPLKAAAETAPQSPPSLPAAETENFETAQARPPTAPEGTTAEPASKTEVRQTAPADDEPASKTEVRQTAPADDESASAIQAPETAQAAPQTAAKQYHTVRSGENLFRIGLRYGLSVDALRRLNRLDEGTAIYPGQKLVVRSDP